MEKKVGLDLVTRVAQFLHIDLPWDKRPPKPACDRCGASPDHEALPFFPDPSTMPREGWRSLSLCKSCAALGLPSGWVLTVHPSKVQVIKLRADGYIEYPDGRVEQWKRGVKNGAR
ncbi:MAG: hypothetical protein JNM40_01890 [Myxococcales bacterium]|nr:hypothetical protein [Myxococcales bacterium]